MESSERECIRSGVFIEGQLSGIGMEVVVVTELEVLSMLGLVGVV